ncbi:MAG: hypothetical protein L6R42_006676 [Xanthoria sp. 1 TBL-2021]|nr:MAG: hypothetical protein L6R42_006676 [Xanthoria sp. 1 TBL-2021]
MEKTLAVISGVLFLVWMVSDVLQGMSEKTPKRDLLKWACRRRGSPTTVLVSYTSVCDEQLAIKYLAVLITVAELGSLVSGVTTWCLIKRRSKLLDEPWRVKA